MHVCVLCATDIRMTLLNTDCYKLLIFTPTSQIINREEWPPYVKDANVSMMYPPGVTIPEDQKFALGHPFYSLLPGLFMYATIWLREHNRVCEVLRKEHPHWEDERIFQTAKLVITGKSLEQDLMAVQLWFKHQRMSVVCKTTSNINWRLRVCTVPLYRSIVTTLA